MKTGLAVDLFSGRRGYGAGTSLSPSRNLAMSSGFVLSGEKAWLRLAPLGAITRTSYTPPPLRTIWTTQSDGIRAITGSRTIASSGNRRPSSFAMGRKGTTA